MKKAYKQVFESGTVPKRDGYAESFWEAVGFLNKIGLYHPEMECTRLQLVVLEGEEEEEVKKKFTSVQKENGKEK